MDRSEIQGICALHTKLAKMDGINIDKKAARYSAMADYVEHVGACSASHPMAIDVYDAITEAIEMAIVGDPMNIPGAPFDRNQWRWMEQSQ